MSPQKSWANCLSLNSQQTNNRQPLCLKPTNPTFRQQVTPPQGEYRLVTCAPKPGQRLKREDVDSRDTFLLKDQDDGRCLEFDKKLNWIELVWGENANGFLCGCFFVDLDDFFLFQRYSQYSTSIFSQSFAVCWTYQKILEAFHKLLFVSAMDYMCLSPITRYGMLPIGFTKMAVHVKDTEHPKLLKPGYHLG